MASLVLKMSVSLDGYVAPIDGSADWVAAGRSDDGASWTVETLSNAGAHLMGAATYAGWAAYWPGASGPFAKPMNEIPKVVFSDSLVSAGWGETTIATASWPLPSRGSSGRARTVTCSPTAGCGSPDRWSGPA
jgi:dihydrofolate reductase